METNNTELQDYILYIKGLKPFKEVIQHSTGDNISVIHSD